MGLGECLENGGTNGIGDVIPGSRYSDSGSESDESPLGSGMQGDEIRGDPDSSRDAFVDHQ